MAASDKIWRLQIHLLKDRIVNIDDAIKLDKVDDVFEATGELEGGRVYARVAPASPPRWAEFLGEAAAGLQANYFSTSSSSSVLIIPAGGRHFALTFGYGRSLLGEAVTEPDFGLRTALNICDGSTVRTVDYRAIVDRTLIGRIQASDKGNVNAFRLDLSTDLLRGIGAEPVDQARYGSQVAARWESLLISRKIGPQQLVPLLVQLLAEYSGTRYQQEFPWVDNIRKVRDSILLADLDSELENRIDIGAHTNIRLAIPEIYDPMHQLAPKLFREDGIDFSHSIQEYLNTRPRASARGTLHGMKSNHRVYLVRTDNQTSLKDFSVYKCIVAEIDFNGNTYLMADGEWYALKPDFVAEIEAAMGSINCQPHNYPGWQRGQLEEDWNVLASGSDRNTCLLDKSNIRIGYGNSSVEAADLLCRRTRTLWYVKRRDKSSSGLSHLFAQGRVAAETIANDRRYRTCIADRLPRDFGAIATELRRNSFSRQQWTIGYIILGASQNAAADLPFFSKVNLRQTDRSLAGMQYSRNVVGA